MRYSHSVQSPDSNTVTIQIPDYSGIQMVEASPVYKGSVFKPIPETYHGVYETPIIAGEKSSYSSKADLSTKSLYFSLYQIQTTDTNLLFFLSD